MLGLGQLIMVECKSCKRGWSLDPEESKILTKQKNNYYKTMKCKWCGFEFSYLDGITQDLFTKHPGGQKFFICNLIDGGQCEVNVGYSREINLNIEIPFIKEINLTCQNGFAAVVPLQINNKKFLIVSSEIPDGLKVGEKLKLYWSVSGRSEWEQISIPTWERLLVQAKEEILNEQFNLAILTCEMSFESFIDSLLYKRMRAKGLSEDFVSAVIEKMNSIQTKVDKLLKELYSLKLASNKKLNKNWREIIKIRNKIAHGVLVNISKEQAEDAFEVIVGLIFYVYLNISEDI